VDDSIRVMVRLRPSLDFPSLIFLTGLSIHQLYDLVLTID